MGKLNYFLVAAVLGMVACSENEQSVPEMLLPDGGIVFKAQINPASRATETYFETNDAIGVFAVESSGSDVAGVLSGNGNYADNVRYVYDGSQFTSASGIEKVDGVSLYYHAVYPYCADAKATYEFDIQTNQQGTGYTESDLLTAALKGQAFRDVLDAVKNCGEKMVPADYDKKIDSQQTLLGALIETKQLSDVFEPKYWDNPKEMQAVWDKVPEKDRAQLGGKDGKVAFMKRKNQVMANTVKSVLSQRTKRMR